ncbi:hypothetical protein GYMLUDRAFT_833725 [Collybiopsis luxurians FD-317 M1]|uniref:Extracellular serine-rich protein n=1 Tax=Collybiopsis luxurians FD-317 M1 TaxID=944289 RepID=A0A0D0CKJ7_9AGAR|nr:hypothetical protein GYMLUDRAFT_833725 [Collybiopsis luxurians FD-317 M1]
MVKMVDSALFLLFLTGWIIGVRGQFNVQVQVGVEGSFYTPGTVSAGMNDVVTFVFGGDFHDVTQSSFENPCVPLPGGFSSGFAGRGADFSNPTPVWNLQITNVSGPLWFFCAATEPTFHCASGMVGAINPPSQEVYSSFVAAAKNTSPTATVAVSYVPNGVGAFATSSPAPVSSSVATTSPASSASNESHILGPAEKQPSQNFTPSHPVQR